MKVASVKRDSVDMEKAPVYSEQNKYTDKYKGTLVTFSGADSLAKNFRLRVWAYDEGIAFRYEFGPKKELEVISESTEFAFEEDSTIRTSSRSQSPIEELKMSQLKGASARPLLTKFSDSVFVALGEAGLVDFAPIKLVLKEGLPIP